MSKPPNGRSQALRSIIRSYINYLDRQAAMRKGLLDPRDPDAEIHLVLTPFEAAALLRGIEHMTTYYTQSSLLPVSNALRSIGVTPATLDEIMKGTLQ